MVLFITVLSINLLYTIS